MYRRLLFWYFDSTRCRLGAQVPVICGKNRMFQVSLAAQGGCFQPGPTSPPRPRQFRLSLCSLVPGRVEGQSAISRCSLLPLNTAPWSPAKPLRLSSGTQNSTSPCWPLSPVSVLPSSKCLISKLKILGSWIYWRNVLLPLWPGMTLSKENGFRLARCLDTWCAFHLGSTSLLDGFPRVQLADPRQHQASAPGLLPLLVGSTPTRAVSDSAFLTLPNGVFYGSLGDVLGAENTWLCGVRPWLDSALSLTAVSVKGFRFKMRSTYGPWSCLAVCTRDRWCLVTVQQMLIYFTNMYVCHYYEPGTNPKT